VSQVIGTILSLIMRGVFLLAAAIFFASLLVVAVFVLVLWLLRALWARLTGQPVSPWTFQFRRQGAWQRFYSSSAPDPSTSRADADVIDVQSKEVKEIEK
jgi:hypothetical protein